MKRKRKVHRMIKLGFLHDVTKIQTTKLMILLIFYFHVVLEQLKTKIHTNCHSEWALGFVTDYT